MNTAQQLTSMSEVIFNISAKRASEAPLETVIATHDAYDGSTDTPPDRTMKACRAMLLLDFGDQGMLVIERRKRAGRGFPLKQSNRAEKWRPPRATPLTRLGQGRE